MKKKFKPITKGELNGLIKKRLKETDKLITLVKKFLIEDSMGDCEPETLSDRGRALWKFSLDLDGYYMKIFFETGGYGFGDGHIKILYNNILVFECTFVNGDKDEKRLQIYKSGSWEDLISKDKIEQLIHLNDLKLEQERLAQRQREEEAEQNRPANNEEIAYAQAIGAIEKDHFEIP